jgi:hypothetical protein
MKKRKYYRNLCEVEGCEPASLWYLNDHEYLILVNDDEFIQVKFNDYREQFYEVPDPVPKK